MSEKWTPALLLGVGALGIILGWGNPALMICGWFLVLLALAVDADRFWVRSMEARERLDRDRRA